MKTSICLLAFLIATGLNACSCYSNSINLPASPVYLYWDYNSTTITAELHATNATWIIFGIQSLNASSSGTTDGIVAYLDKTTGIGHFSDRYSLKSSSSILQRDANTDWIPLDVYYSGNDLVVKFTRPIIRCDSTGQDIDINIGLMTVMYAYGLNYNVLGIKGNSNISLSNSFYVNTANITIIPQSASSTINLSCPTAAVVPTFDSQPTDTYLNYAELMTSTYRFYWNFTSTSLTGEIHVKTTGWVGFGLSPNGGMPGSDVIVGWITSDGHVNFTDRHIDSSGSVLIDTVQNWQLLFSREQNGYTVFKFTRLIHTCDSQDRDIEVGTPHLIFSFGNSDPATGSDITYHGVNNRGTQELSLISSPSNDQQQLPDNLQKLQFIFYNVIIPKVETYYYNELFKVPDLPSKMHVLKQELTLPSINLGNMHHSLLYDCGSYNGSPSIPPGDSTTNDIFDSTCVTPNYAWAVGGALSSVMPNNTGFPIGLNSGFTYVRLELHYNNPALNFAYIDYVIMTLYVTSNLRKYDSGMLMLMASVDAIGIAIPPGETSYNVSTYCYNSCFRSGLNGSNINVFRVFSHTHYTGTRISTRLLRNNTEIGNVFDNPYYDFNFQQTYALYPYLVLTPDDSMITTCTYNTISRTNFTYGGFGTRQEMCIQYLTYYPKANDFVHCLSVPDYSQLYAFLLNLNRSGLVHLDPLTNYDYYTYINQGLKSVNQISPLTKQAFDKFNANHSFYSSCEGGAISRAPITPNNNYTAPSSCSQQSTTTTMTTASVTTSKSPINSLISMIINALQNIWSYLFH